MSSSPVGHHTHKDHKSLERDKPKHSRHAKGQSGIQPRKNGRVLGELGADGGDEEIDPNDPNYDDGTDADSASLASKDSTASLNQAKETPDKSSSTEKTVG